MLQTEYEFTLPMGYVDAEGTVHKQGVMRLATAADEIVPLKDPRVRQNPEYLTVLVLERTIVKLEGVESVSAQVIEKLFTADLSFLQELYQKINEGEEPTMQVTCTRCGQDFTTKMNFKG